MRTRGSKVAKEIILGDIIGKGKRGIVRRGTYGTLDVAIKIVNPKSEAICRIENEGNWLKKLNKKKIGPKFYFLNASMLVMGYLEGVHLEKFMKKSDRTKDVLKSILQQCRSMDKMHVDKNEMHRITKNCIVVNNNPVLIDFERCRYSIKPKNVTQFCQFLMRTGFCKDKKNVLQALQEYKFYMSEKNFKTLEKFFF